MRSEHKRLRIVEEDIGQHYIDCLDEFCRHYDIPTFFVGNISDESITQCDQPELHHVLRMPALPSEVDAMIGSIESA